MTSQEDHSQPPKEAIEIETAKEMGKSSDTTALLKIFLVTEIVEIELPPRI